MKKYTYQTIENVNGKWFIVSYNKTESLQSKKKYILVGITELQNILANGIDWFLQETMITSYSSKKSLVEKYRSEPFYKHLFI